MNTIRAMITITAVLIPGFTPYSAELKSDAAIRCSSCDGWNQSQAPFKIHGNTFYVGTAGLSSVLIATDKGLILLDADLPQSAALIDEHIRSLGYRTTDIRFIVNSHVHFDHVGGIAALQRASGATIAVSSASAVALTAGELQPDDPQYGMGKRATSFPAVTNTKIIKDGEVLRVGDIAITAHLTPGHTPGGTTWTWKSCEQSKCIDIVYADSLNAVSADGFRFSDDPKLVETFRHSIAIVEKMPCDILIPVHPEFSDIQGKAARLKAGEKENPFIDNQACRNYAVAAAEKLKNRLATEQR